jgi:hypothetical protein
VKEVTEKRRGGEGREGGGEGGGEKRRERKKGECENE